MLDTNVQHEVLHTSPLLTIPISVIPEHTIFNPSKTITTASAITIYSLLSSLFPSLQQSTPIPTPTTTEATTSTPSVLESETLNAIHLRLSYMEKEVKDLKNKNRALCNSLLESILEDEEAMDEGVAENSKKRKPDDVDKDEGPSAGSDQGHLFKVSKSGTFAKDQVEELIFVQDSDYAEHNDIDMPRDQGENLGKLVDDGPEQSWLNDMAKATKAPLTFDQLIHTPIDFSTFVMNHLKIDNLTKEILNNPEGHRCPYDLTKPLHVQMSSQGHQIVLTNFFFNNDLEYLRGGSNDKKYTASTIKSKAARRTVIQARVEDLQLGVESYQKKLNLTNPRTRDVDMSRKPTYTTLSNPQDVIYKDKPKQKRFMRADELHKFSNDTLISVRDTLSQMLHELHLGYNKAMRRRK
ncbi:hypothetical protein Tco_1038779 [Tanacetum coccineum]